MGGHWFVQGLGRAGAEDGLGRERSGGRDQVLGCPPPQELGQGMVLRGCNHKAGQAQRVSDG